MEMCPYSYFRWCGYFWIPWVHLLRQMSTQWVSQELLQGLVSHDLTAYLSVFYLFLTQSIMTILPKGCKLDNFESHSSLKLSFANIWSLCSNFVDRESFLESNSPDILALWKTNFDDSTDSGNLSVTGYLPLIQKDCTTDIYTWSCGLCIYGLYFPFHETYL